MHVPDIPDAPWIRDAEQNGVGGEEDMWYCPVCGAECPDYIYTVNLRGGGEDPVGCSECLNAYEGWTYDDKH